MIHLLLTQSTAIRDACIAHYGLHPHATDNHTFQSGGTILVFRDTLTPEILHEVTEAYVAEKIWVLVPSRIVSTEHEIGDIVMPNVFLRYSHEIDEVEFTRNNRDEYLSDPLFLHHFEEQSDLDFETFGLSIGGICVTKEDGMDGCEREQLEFAYSADCIDEVCYPLIESAIRQERAEDVYPVLIIMGSEASQEEQQLLAKNAPPVIAYLQSFFEHDHDGENTSI
jgi:hypothetical protein